MSELKHNAKSLHGVLESYFFNRWTTEEVTGFILALEPKWQSYVLDWVISVAKTQPEIAYQYALNVGRALDTLGWEASEQWLQKSLDIYFAEGLYPAVQVIKNLDEFIAQHQQLQRGLLLSDVRGILQNFLYGLHGRSLEIHPGDEVYTDSERIYLPEIIDYFELEHDNFACYKAMVAYLWAQNWYGTWRINIKTEFSDNQDWLQCFHYLETLRLNACIERDFPGLGRQIRHINQLSGNTIHSHPQWQEIEKKLSTKEARTKDSFELVPSAINLPLPTAFCYQGVIMPERVQQVREQRLQREKNQFQLNLARIANDLSKLEDNDSKTRSDQPDRPRFDLKPPDSSQNSNSSYELELDGVAIPPDVDTRSLMVSIIQDLGDLPPDYLVAASSGQYYAALEAQSKQADSENVWKGTYHEKGAHLYNEWDCTRKAHRKRWCALREKDIVGDYNSTFIEDTLYKYRGHIKSLRRSFEALRDEYKILKKQPDGENLDIDALVEAIADVRSGMEMTSRIYRKAMRSQRNIAVVFMVDMSGSTKGWINTVQREALVLLSEALKGLNDRYAIYGFSGMTRKRCELYKIKSFEDQYDNEVKARIAAIEPQDYTRMGVTIRHLSTLLESVNAKTKLLITLSDGKPDDYDSYHGEYGIEDTRMALFEARQKGIHPFCITIDEQAREYLPHMYGDSNYVVIDNVAKLPYRISEVYRGLTG